MHRQTSIDDAFLLRADDEAEGFAFELVELDHGVLRFGLTGLAADFDRDVPEVALLVGGAGDGDFADPLARLPSSS